MEPRRGVHHPKAGDEGTYTVIVGPSGGVNDAVGASAGWSAYRDGDQRDHGPDLDEPVDENESRDEILPAALQAARY